MLLVATVIAVGCLPALAAAFVLPNEFIAWSCAATSAIGLIILIVDGRRQRTRKREDAGKMSISQDGSAAERDPSDSVIDSATEAFTVPKADD
jgi:hypothetical protein